jgi:hypothetical protein
MKCEGCGRDFNSNRWWQKFCSKGCQQQWNRDQYRTQRVEFGQLVRDKLTERITEEQKQEIVGPLIASAEQRKRRIEQRINGHLVEEQRRQANETMAKALTPKPVWRRM